MLVTELMWTHLWQEHGKPLLARSTTIWAPDGTAYTVHRMGHEFCLVPAYHAAQRDKWQPIDAITLQMHIYRFRWEPPSSWDDHASRHVDAIPLMS